MLVRFRSAFFDGNTLWRIGVHNFPDTINNRKVVFALDKDKPKNAFVLPVSATLASGPEIVESTAEIPRALSELNSVRPAGFVEAMKQ